jgi:hypothetical protein
VVRVTHRIMAAWKYDWKHENELARTALELGLVLELVVRLHAAQELLLAPGGVHMLDAHVDALRDNPSVDLCDKAALKVLRT